MYEDRSNLIPIAETGEAELNQLPVHECHYQVGGTTNGVRDRCRQKLPPEKWTLHHLIIGGTRKFSHNNNKPNVFLLTRLL